MYNRNVYFFLSQDLLAAVGHPAAGEYPVQEENLQGRLHRHLQPGGPAHRVRAAGGRMGRSTVRGGGLGRRRARVD